MEASSHVDDLLLKNPFIVNKVAKNFESLKKLFKSELSAFRQIDQKFDLAVSELESDKYAKYEQPKKDKKLGNKVWKDMTDLDTIESTLEKVLNRTKEQN